MPRDRDAPLAHEDDSPGDITLLLEQWSDGDQAALAELVPLVYDELRGLAAAYLRREPRGHTLPTSALVNEAFLRLVEQKRVQWRNRTHFFGIAARLMRRILVDHARRYLYAKRGAGARRLSLDQLPELGVMRPDELVALDDALCDLAVLDPDQVRVVELRYFGGLTGEEIGELLGISIPTVTRRWRMARAWLYRYLSAEVDDGQ